MSFEGLDYKSEKILQHFKKYDTLNISQLNILLDSRFGDYGGFLVILLKSGYIQNAEAGRRDDKMLYQNGTYSITTLGKVYFDLRFKSRLYAVSRSLIAPIVVSLITNLAIILLRG